MTGSTPGLAFQLVNFWAHLWMGLTAAFVPVLFSRLWSRLRTTTRSAVVGMLALAWSAPYVFAFGSAHTWQFEAQAGLESAAFARTELRLRDEPTVSGSGGTARYTVPLDYGPREYTTYSHAHRAVDAEDIDITGRIVRQNRTIAWCTGVVDALPTMASVRDPERYFPALRRLDRSPINVRCFGPGRLAGAVGSAVTVEYDATMRQLGERTGANRRFTGAVRTRLSAS